MSTWSDSLKKLTREVLYDCPVGSFIRDNKCYLKNYDGRFAAISLNDALNEKYIIHLLNEHEGITEFFDSIDDLVEAGWAVD